VVLRDCGEALIEDELQRLVIRANDERATPKVWPPVAHCLR